MSLGQPIKVRLETAERLDYEELAAANCQPLSAWIRDQLRKGVRVSDELASLRRSLDAFMERESNRAQTSQSAPSQSTDAGMLLEILLLMRARDQVNQRMVQAEVARNGLKVWGPNDATAKTNPEKQRAKGGF